MVKGSDNGDVNRGSGGQYIYLYFTRDTQVGGSGYSDLDIIYGQNTEVPAGWEKVSTDLN